MKNNNLPLPLKLIVVYFIGTVIIAAVRFIVRFPEVRPLFDVIVYALMTFGIIKRLEVARKLIAIFLALDLMAFIYFISTRTYDFTMIRYVRWGGNFMISILIIIYMVWSTGAKAALVEQRGSKVIN